LPIAPGGGSFATFKGLHLRTRFSHFGQAERPRAESQPESSNRTEKPASECNLRAGFRVSGHGTFCPHSGIEYRSDEPRNRSLRSTARQVGIFGRRTVAARAVARLDGVVLHHLTSAMGESPVESGSPESGERQARAVRYLIESKTHSQQVFRLAGFRFRQNRQAKEKMPAW